MQFIPIELFPRFKFRMVTAFKMFYLQALNWKTMCSFDSSWNKLIINC